MIWLALWLYLAGLVGSLIAYIDVNMGVSRRDAFPSPDQLLSAILIGAWPITIPSVMIIRAILRRSRRAARIRRR